MSVDLSSIIKQPAHFMMLDETEYESFLKKLRTEAATERQSVINYLEQSLAFFDKTRDSDLSKYPRNEWGLLGKAIELATIDDNSLSVHILKHLARSKKHLLVSIWNDRQLPNIVTQYLNPLTAISVKKSASNALLELKELIQTTLKKQTAPLKPIMKLKTLLDLQFKRDANEIYQQFLLKKAFDLALSADSVIFSPDGYVVCEFTIGFFDYLELFKQLGITPPLGVDDTQLHSLLSNTLDHQLATEIECHLDVAMHPSFYDAYLQWMQQLAYQVKQTTHAQSDRQQIAIALKSFLKIKPALELKNTFDYPTLVAIALLCQHSSRKISNSQLKDLQKNAISQLNHLLKMFIQRVLIDSAPIKKPIDTTKLLHLLKYLKTQATAYSARALMEAYRTLFGTEHHDLAEEFEIQGIDLAKISFESITTRDYLKFSANGGVLHCQYCSETTIESFVSTATEIIALLRESKPKSKSNSHEIGDYQGISDLLKKSSLASKNKQ